MANRLNVALLQVDCDSADAGERFGFGEAACRKAREMGADIALLPEMWSNGYEFFDRAVPGAEERWRLAAVDTSSAYILGFQALAAELDMAIVATYLGHTGGPPLNSASLIDRRGNVVSTYSKVHTCDFGDEAALTPGPGFEAANLDTAAGRVRVGMMICYDREFPESARILMLQGAELILTPNSCTIDPLRLGQLQARSYENMCAIAMTNYPSPKCNGHSAAYDGIAYNRGGGPGRDMLAVLAGDGQGIFMASFDLDGLREYRERETWGDSYRKPRAYRMLASTSEALAPFVRPDSRRK